MSQEKYDYVVLSKQDFMEEKEKKNESFFSVDKFNNELGKYGDDGFRVITRLYNGEGDWLLILSKPIYVPNPTGGRRIRGE